MPFSYTLEKKVAVAAVLRACSLTSSVFKNLVQGETITKDDKSPVTIADYSAQAVINVILSQAFPDDHIIGEETSQDLVADTPEKNQLRSRIKELANEALRTSIGGNDKAEWGMGPDVPEKTEEELLKAIDRGSYAGGAKGRMWTLDPIDGTKGFLRGGQYAVCLALIVYADVKLAVMGCPNLPVDVENPEGERGVLFVAVKNQGTEQRAIAHPRESSLIHLNPLPQSPGGRVTNAFQSMSFDPAPAPTLTAEPPTDVLQILESVEAAHSSHSLVARIQRKLGITKPSVRMDSQAKYGSLARGDGSVYLRMPVGKGEYQEKIWDHAAGALILEEAGALVTDTRGERLNFGLGRTLGQNFGIVAAPEDVHKAVLRAVQECKAEEARDDEEADRAMQAEAAAEKAAA